MYRNYETSLALVCFAEANRDGRYDKLIKNAEKFLKDNQWAEDEGQDKASPSYGGAGYGKHKRPDLSNTHFLIDALRAAGAGPDDEAMKKALIFVSRCQNLESEHNTLPLRAKNPDGGFYYTRGRRRREPGRQNARRRTAQLRLDDLRRTEEHDLRRRRARRSPRQGRRQVDRSSTTICRAIPAWALRALLLLPHVRQGAGRVGMKD